MITLQISATDRFNRDSIFAILQEQGLADVDYLDGGIWSIEFELSFLTGSDLYSMISELTDCGAVVSFSA